MPVVPDRTIYDPVLDAHLHTGENAIEMGRRFGQGHLATDIETPGLDNAFTINCVTMAWTSRDETHSILLDPRRVPAHAELVRDMYARATMIILHNAPFDVPSLYHAGLISLAQVNKIVDTVVLARFGFPDQIVSKTLAALAKRLLGMDDNAEGMKVAFKAAGYRTIDEGYRRMDIDSPIYRQGAMLDTIATLRLQPILREHCWAWSLEHPFSHYGATTHAEAEALVETQEIVHRVMLRRTAVGLAVDREYLAKYAEQVDTERRLAETQLAAHGLAGGRSKGGKLVEYLDSIGELPQPWPRSPKTRRLRATKDDLQTLDHPLARAQRTLTDIEMVTGWISQVDHQAETTGRCHPQCGTLAASATGRMSYTSPPMQQFSADARPIICDDGQGLTSIDWSQIEPVTMGLMAGDEMFLAPYERGDDLYEPLMRAAGIDRPRAKVNLLGTMYGLGIRGLAVKLDTTEDAAAQIRRQMLLAMQDSARWMVKVQGIAETHGKVITAAGRILPVDAGGVFKAVNYVVQGSAYDVLANTIVEMARQGIGDHLQLAMHDEVIVDTEVAEAVREIMLTPPEFLVRWAGRTPTLRTDRADMGTSWQKV